MATSITEIYRSSNGDRWQIVRIKESRSKEPHGKEPISALVRHIPNPSSGGTTTDASVADFLSTNGPGPEYAALRRLLESAADEPGAT